MPDGRNSFCHWKGLTKPKTKEFPAVGVVWSWFRWGVVATWEGISERLAA